MRLRRLWVQDFRNYRSVHLDLADRLTVIVGSNGQGKSNLLEAVAYIASLRSFRGAPVDALVRDGTQLAVVRAEVEREGRSLLIEAEINRAGRSRTQVNRQRLPRARDLLGAFQVVVFSPDDLGLIKGGPAERRSFLDDLLVALHPRHDLLRSDVERILRQRNALLKQAAGKCDASVTATLDIWDEKLATTGEELVAVRLEVLHRLEPLLATAYAQLNQRGNKSSTIKLSYLAPWREPGLAAALSMARRDDLRRGVTTVGPHRDDVVLSLDGLPSRTHASQGEQRALALALRLAAHRLIEESIGSAPVLLLDDVFSELDPGRCESLVESLPHAQTILTTASEPPVGTTPELVVRVHDGFLIPNAE